MVGRGGGMLLAAAAAAAVVVLVVIGNAGEHFELEDSGAEALHPKS